MLFKRKGAAEQSIKTSTPFAGSKNYWETRYQAGRDSGAGSCGRLAVFKAGVLNNFVTQNKVETVVELGCGDGNQLSLANYPNYIGFDVSKEAIRICAEKFKNDYSKSFFWYDPDYFFNHSGAISCDAVLSLDVIFHLVEDSVFERYMQTLFEIPARYVIIYSSNLRDTGETAPHVKHRVFTQWITRNHFEYKHIVKIGNDYPFDPNKPDVTSFADFYIYERHAS